MGSTAISIRRKSHIVRNVKNDKGEAKSPLYMRFLRGGEHDLAVEWFKLDTSSWEMSPSLEVMTADNAFRNSNAVTLGSFIYVVGGRLRDWESERPHDVYYYNTLHPERGWCKAPSLLAAWLFPVVFSFDGKIYGGACYYEVYAEVYDPLKNSWEALPKPPDDFDIDGHLNPFHAILTDYDGRNPRVLLLSSGTKSLYAFYFEAKSWVLFDPEFGDHYSRSAVVDDVFYCIFNHGKSISLGAYDLRHKQWLPGTFIEFPRGVVNNPVCIYLLNLSNGKLCWTSRDKAGDCVLQTIRIEMIIVGAVPCYINATQESATIFALEPDLYLVNMLAL